MPLVTLSLEAGRTGEQKRQLADAVYEALRAAIQIPENDRFVAIREHAAGDMIADPGYLGVARSGHPVSWRSRCGAAGRRRRSRRSTAFSQILCPASSREEQLFLTEKLRQVLCRQQTPFVKTLYREIAERMGATGLVRTEDLLIVLHENDTADWSFGNGVAQYVEREQKEREQREQVREWRDR